MKNGNNNTWSNALAYITGKQKEGAYARDVHTHLSQKRKKWTLKQTRALLADMKENGDLVLIGMKYYIRPYAPSPTGVVQKLILSIARANADREARYNTSRSLYP